MQFQSDDILLVTGATGLVGSHVCQRARELGIQIAELIIDPRCGQLDQAKRPGEFRGCLLYTSPSPRDRG